MRGEFCETETAAIDFAHRARLYCHPIPSSHHLCVVCGPPSVRPLQKI